MFIPLGIGLGVVVFNLLSDSKPDEKAPFIDTRKRTRCRKKKNDETTKD